MPHNGIARPLNVVGHATGQLGEWSHHGRAQHRSNKKTRLSDYGKLFVVAGDLFQLFNGLHVTMLRRRTVQGVQHSPDTLWGTVRVHCVQA